MLSHAALQHPCLQCHCTARAYQVLMQMLGKLSDLVSEPMHMLPHVDVTLVRMLHNLH